jgi:hypothetical protein
MKIVLTMITGIVIFISTFMALSFKKEASEVVSPILESTQDTLLAATPKPYPVMEPIEDDDVVVEASPLLIVVTSPSPSPSQLKSNQHREDRERDDDEEDD